MLPLGPRAGQQGDEVLALLDLIRITDTVLRAAGSLMPTDIRTLDTIHLATAQLLGTDLGRVVTYDERMATAARGLGFQVARPE